MATTEQRIKLDLFVIKAMKNFDESHAVEHVFKVWKNAQAIACSIEFADFFKNETHEPYKSNWTLLEFAAKLHDVLDHKYADSIAAGDLDRFLHGFGEVFASHVKFVMQNVSFSKQKKNGVTRLAEPIVNTVRDIVADADRIEALGLEGIRRCRKFIQSNRGFVGGGDIDTLVVNHCHDKLLLLYGVEGFITSARGRDMAAPLHEEIVQFVKDHGGSSVVETKAVVGGKKRKLPSSEDETKLPCKEAVGEIVARCRRIISRFKFGQEREAAPADPEAFWEHSDTGEKLQVRRDTFAPCWKCGIKHCFKTIDGTAKDPEIYQCTECEAQWLPLDGMIVWEHGLRRKHDLL